MEAARTDAVGVFRWGLRRYWLLFLLCVVLGAAFAPHYIEKISASSTDATALVVAERLQVNLITLPRYGEAVFNNGQVAQAVAAKYGTPGQLQDIIPTRLSLTDNQNSIVFQVTGHDPDPKVAAGIANTATTAFLDALNAGGVGVGHFVLQSPAQPPSPVAPLVGSGTAVLVGLVAGALLGLAVITALLVARRPIIEMTDAEAAAGVAALGLVRVPRTPRGAAAPPEAFEGLAPACRRILSLSTPTLLLLSRRRDAHLRQKLSVALATAISPFRDVSLVGIESEPIPEHELVPAGKHGTGVGERASAPSSRRSLTVLDSAEPLDLVQPPAATAAVLVVRQGISAAALRTAVVENLGGSAEPRLLLVRRGRRLRGRHVRDPH